AVRLLDLQNHRIDHTHTPDGNPDGIERLVVRHDTRVIAPTLEFQQAFVGEHARFLCYPPFLSARSHEMDRVNPRDDGADLEFSAVSPGRERASEGLPRRGPHGPQREPALPKIIQQFVNLYAGFDMDEVETRGAPVAVTHV